MRAYIVRGFDQDDDARVAVIYTSNDDIGRKVDALRWGRVTVEMVADHLTVVL